MAKQNDNDKRILALKKTIADKKSELKSAEKFNPKTNCSLELDGERVNLHAAPSATLARVMVKLNMYKISEKDLGIEGTEISGFKIQDWLDDVKTKFLMSNKQQETEKLKAQEKLLHDLLSTETKTELLISEIEGSLK